MAKYLLALFIVVVGNVSAFAQQIEMADTMRAEGKIYVVVAVLSIVMIGIAGYLFSLDKKMSRLEKKLEK